MWRLHRRPRSPPIVFSFRFVRQHKDQQKSRALASFIGEKHMETQAWVFLWFRFAETKENQHRLPFFFVVSVSFPFYTGQVASKQKLR
jgi:hypothetical protein